MSPFGKLFGPVAMLWLILSVSGLDVGSDDDDNNITV